MTNEQIAHDLAIARMAGKGLPADILVSEYRKAYSGILEYLNSESVSSETTPAKIMKSPI